jgi:hypothetical protein
LGTEEKEVKGGGGCSVNNGLNEDVEKLAFHAGDSVGHDADGVKTFF